MNKWQKSRFLTKIFFEQKVVPDPVGPIWGEFGPSRRPYSAGNGQKWSKNGKFALKMTPKGAVSRTMRAFGAQVAGLVLGHGMTVYGVRGVWDPPYG